jgi:hypothetical protein
MKRTSVHSRLIQHRASQSDDTDGEGMEDAEASFHLGGEV